MNWFRDLFKSKFLETLAGKLTAILSFAIILIVILAVLGASIEDRWLPLVYIVAIAAMGIFTYQVFTQNKASLKDKKETGEEKPRSESPESNKGDQKDEKRDGKMKASPHDARERYLNAVIADTRSMRLVGLDPQAADPARGGLTLESLYVSLDTTTIIDETVEIEARKRLEKVQSNDNEMPDFDFGGTHRRSLGALEALYESENRQMVLLGLPGTGKSTFVRFLALRMAQTETDRSKNIKDLLPGWKGGTILPLILSLGRMAETVPDDCKKGSALLIENYIKQTLQADERTSDFSEFILSELEKVGGLVLFDGLDEVANLDLRPIVVQAVEDFVQKYGRQNTSRFLVTCRTYSYYHDTKWQLTGWATHELALLDDEKIEHFINAWHNEHIRIEPSRKPDLERKRVQLLASLQPDDRRRLHEIAPFPIILTMMAVVHTHYGELPDTRAEVYERCVDLLLVRWEIERPVSGQSQETHKRTIIDELGISRVVLDRALWEIAFKAHEGREDDNEKKRGPALVTEDLLTGILQTHFQDLSKVKVFLDYCQSSNGLLMLQGSVMPADAPPNTPPRRVYAFPHLTFEEYLAARYLIRPNFGKTTSELVQKSDRWREVVMLLGEYLCFAQGDQERMDNLLSALTPSKPPTKVNDTLWRSIWYAGDLLSLYRRVFPSETSPSDKGINTGLHKLVLKNALSPRERASAADTLDELGYVIPDLHTFIPIADSPTPDLHMGKYLVTNAQYERFLEVRNFENKDLWCDFPKFDESSKNMNETWGEDGWKWLQESLKEEEEEKVLYPRYWRDPRFGVSRRNAPVVGISWYEASAYCKWLYENWNDLDEGKQGLPKPKSVRLPTDEEWSIAAGGEDPESRYAFGELKDKKDISRFANTDESGINRTTPVWMYPQGESPHHIRDMTGNVWEWQANIRNIEIGKEKHEGRGLRGGSWLNNGILARVSLRYDYHPGYGYYYLGFRVVVLPSG
jgi:formylglycine-generating enzyme required for sulfatase activity